MDNIATIKRYVQFMIKYMYKDSHFKIFNANTYFFRENIGFSLEEFLPITVTWFAEGFYLQHGKHEKTELQFWH